MDTRTPGRAPQAPRPAIGRLVMLGLALTAVLASCSDPVEPEPVVWDEYPWMGTSIEGAAVSVTATATPVDTAPDQRRVYIRFANVGTDSVRVSHGACSFGIRLREARAAALMPVAWDNRVDACILPLYWFYVPANGTRDVRVFDLNPRTLRGRVASGTYDIYVTWREANSSPVREARAGTIAVP